MNTETESGGTSCAGGTYAFLPGFRCASRLRRPTALRTCTRARSAIRRRRSAAARCPPVRMLQSIAPVVVAVLVAVFMAVLGHGYPWGCSADYPEVVGPVATFADVAACPPA